MKNNLLNPKISILTPAYNAEDFLEKTIDSVQKQTYSNWELIIINDGSIDNTEKIIKDFAKKDKRIKYYANEKNMGIVATLNKGIKLCSGQFIARLDSDDLWIDDKKIEKQIKYLLENPDTVLIGSWGYKIDAKDKKTADIKYPVTNRDIKKYLLIENSFLNSSVIFKKDVCLKVGSYEEEYRTAEDFALWLKLGQVGKLHNLPEYMIGYRTNEKGISMTRYNEQIANTIKAVHKYHDSYPFYFLALILWYARKEIPRSFRENLSKMYREFAFNNNK